MGYVEIRESRSQNQAHHYTFNLCVNLSRLTIKWFLNDASLQKIVGLVLVRAWNDYIGLLSDTDSKLIDRDTGKQTFSVQQG